MYDYYRLFNIHTVYCNRYGGGFRPDEYGYDDAPANHDFGTLQDITFCHGRWLESGDNESCKNLLLMNVPLKCFSGRVTGSRYQRRNGVTNDS